ARAAARTFSCDALRTACQSTVSLTVAMASLSTQRVADSICLVSPLASLMRRVWRKCWAILVGDQRFLAGPDLLAWCKHSRFPDAARPYRCPARSQTVRLSP